jgi:hypothetical protein
MCGNVNIAPPEPAAENLAKVAEIEARLINFKPNFMEVTHTFCNRVYTRSGKIKAGEIIIGAKHRVRSVFHIAKGKIWVYDNFHGLRLLAAPFSEITLPETQRIGLGVEDVEGCNIFETDCTTIEDVEFEMLYPFTLPANVGATILQLCNQKLIL